ncbi:unnamed protein product, partial [Mesorhabditis spiculigera]
MLRIYGRGYRLFSTSSARNAPRVAVIGSGPAGLFTCAGLLRRAPTAVIDVLDAAPVPFGLVRYGVAPDHQEVKNCINGFEKIFNDHPTQMNLFSYGAHRPRRLEVPGAEAKNVISGSDFVSWYNGVPNASPPVLDGKNVVIIGNGNVALDCARILSSVENLASTDIPEEPLAVLEKSKVSNITLVGRRGPENVSFTIKELREQFKIKSWSSIVALREEEKAGLVKSLDVKRKKRMFQILLDNIGHEAKAEKNCRFIFNHVPIEVFRDENGRVKSVRFLDKITGKKEDLACELLIYSIGYNHIVLEGLPTNDKGALRLCDDCRVDFDPAPTFAAGWCAQGPHGVIVDTQQQSMTVAQRIAEILPNRPETSPGVTPLLESRGVRFITWKEWLAIDEEERRNGQQRGKVREKIMKFEPLLKKK